MDLEVVEGVVEEVVWETENVTEEFEVGEGNSELESVMLLVLVLVGLRKSEAESVEGGDSEWW